MMLKPAFLISTGLGAASALLLLAAPWLSLPAWLQHLALPAVCLGSLLVMLWLFMKSELAISNTQVPTTSQQAADGLEPATVARLGSLLTPAVSEAANDIERADALMREAIEKLVAAFHLLESQLDSQHRMILALNPDEARIDGEPGITDSVALTEFVTNASQTLTAFVDDSLKSSKLAVQTVESMDTVSEAVGSIDSLLEGIQRVAKQTNLLALNAAIEAARAGEAGRGFAVVADEVRKLSDSTNQLSQKIAAVLARVTDSLRQASETVNELASHDMSHALQAKQQITQMFEVIEHSNQARIQIARDADEVSVRVREGIEAAVVSLQFQDMTSQLLGTARHRMTLTAEALSMLQALLHEAHQAQAVLQRKVSELESRSIHAPVTQKSMGTGEVELF